MISTLPLSKLLIWTTVLGPPTIVSMMYMRVIHLRQNTIYRKLLYGLSLMGMFVTSMLLSLAAVKIHFEMWNVPEIVGFDLLMPLVEVGAVFVFSILCAWMLDFAATRLATDVANPLWKPKWKGSVKEKTTRLFFQLVLLWFIIGSFVNSVNYLSGHALLGTQTWMHSFAWTVFLPALAIWWFAMAVKNTRKEIRKGEDSASAL
jgi:hypothetical protein